MNEKKKSYRTLRFIRHNLVVTYKLHCKLLGCQSHQIHFWWKPQHSGEPLVPSPQILRSQLRWADPSCLRATDLLYTAGHCRRGRPQLLASNSLTWQLCSQ